MGWRHPGFIFSSRAFRASTKTPVTAKLPVSRGPAVGFQRIGAFSHPDRDHFRSVKDGETRACRPGPAAYRESRWGCQQPLVIAALRAPNGAGFAGKFMLCWGLRPRLGDASLPQSICNRKKVRIGVAPVFPVFRGSAGGGVWRGGRVRWRPTTSVCNPGSGHRCARRARHR